MPITAGLLLQLCDRGATPDVDPGTVDARYDLTAILSDVLPPLHCGKPNAPKRAKSGVRRIRGIESGWTGILEPNKHLHADVDACPFHFWPVLVCAGNYGNHFYCCLCTSPLRGIQIQEPGR